MLKAGRKNRPEEYNGQNTSSNQDKLVNPPKKSRTEETNLGGMDRSIEGPRLSRIPAL